MRAQAPMTLLTDPESALLQATGDLPDNDAESFNMALLALHGRADADALDPAHAEALFDLQRSRADSPFNLGSLEFIEMTAEAHILDAMLEMFIAIARHAGPERDIAGALLVHNSLPLDAGAIAELMEAMLDCELLSIDFRYCRIG